MTDRVSDAAIHAAVAAVLRRVVLEGPADSAFDRQTMVQLIGLTEYARRRGDDPTASRDEALTHALEALRDNPFVARHWPGEPRTVAAAVLAEAVGGADVHARRVQHVLRPLLVAQLDDELTTTSRLIDAFRGVVSDG